MPLKQISAQPGGSGICPNLMVMDDDAGGVPAAHAPSHTNGVDQVADATFLASGLIQGAEKEKLSSLASAVGATAGDQLIANGGGGSIWTPPVVSMREMVTVSGTDPKAEYATIHDGVDAAMAMGAGPAHWILVMVFPGIYSEAKTTIPAGVVVSAVSAVRSPIVDVRAALATDDLFVMAGGFLVNLQISGVSDALHACVRSSLPGVISRVEQCRFQNCSTGMWVEGGSILLVPTANVTISDGGQHVDRLYFVEGSGGAPPVPSRITGSVGRVIVPASVLALYPFDDPIRCAVHAENGGVFEFTALTLDMQHNTANQVAIEAGAAAHVDIGTLIVKNCHTGVLVNAGVGVTEVHINGGDFEGNTLNWNLQSATCQLLFNGVCGNHLLRTAVAGALECAIFQDSVAGVSTVYGPFNLEYPTTRNLELSRFVEERHSSVVGYGGVTIADEGGIDISVTAGAGWVHRPNTPYFDALDVSWGHAHHTLADNATNYVYIDAATGLLAHGIVAPGVNDLLLFQVLTAAGDIRFMHAVWTDGNSRCKLIEDYLRTTRRVMLNSGLAATINADPHYWDQGGGSYYYGLLLETITGGAQYPFTYYYGAGGASTLAPAGGNHVDLLQYDNAGALAAMGAGEYRSDTLFVTSDGKASVILGTTSNALQATAVAEAAAAAPLFLYPTVFVIAKLIVQQGAGVVQIVDLRTLATTTVAPGAADHNLLANLTAPNDAHPQYMNLSGVRPMTGDLAMGGQSITGVNLVDGVDVSGHGARHNPGAIDAITLGLPTPIQVGDAQAAGGAASVANSAHVHAVTAAAPVSVGTANAIGGAATLVHSDHVHAGLPRTAADFSTFPLKAAPLAADVVLIEDSAAAGAKKYATVGTLGISKAVLHWGNDTVNSSTTTRYLTPGYSSTTAQTSPIQYRIPVACTLRNLYVRQNTGAGNGNAIVYTVRKNGVATTLTCSLASTANDGNDVAHTVAFAQGDLIDIIITKAASVGTSPSTVVASVELY